MVRVISLKDSTRQAVFNEMAKDFSEDWAYFAAYKAVVAPLSYDDTAARLHVGRPLLPAEIGCYVSHYKCWETLVNSDFSQAIIFEDDTAIDWPVIEKLFSIDFQEKGVPILRLFVTNFPKVSLIKNNLVSPHDALCVCYGTVWGMQAYIITKHAARCLVERYATIRMPVDWVLPRYYEHGQLNFLNFPFPLFERQITSTIGAQRDEFVPLPFWGRISKISRLVLRIKERLQRLYFDRLRLPSMAAEVREKFNGPA